ncbi:MAG: hypothetical protein LBS05_00190 [Tannerellaceae bacterium]|jgi:hypothetical protein|nr:hypothetical protein [Tannerellaceae bacterium]
MKNLEMEGLIKKANDFEVCLSFDYEDLKEKVLDEYRKNDEKSFNIEFSIGDVEFESCIGIDMYEGFHFVRYINAVAYKSKAGHIYDSASGCAMAIRTDLDNDTKYTLSNGNFQVGDMARALGFLVKIEIDDDYYYFKK